MRVTIACRNKLCRLSRKPLVSRRRRLRPRITVLPLRARVMTNHSRNGRACGRLSLAHDLDVLLGQLAGLDHGAAQVALSLAALVAEQVFLTRLPALELPVRGHLEPLFGSLVSLHLGHSRHPPSSAGGPQPARP